MKKISGIRVFALSVIAFFVFTFGTAWYVTYSGSDNDSRSDENTDSVKATEPQEETTTEDTVVIFDDYFESEEETVESQNVNDTNYVGMNFEQVQEKIDEMNQSPATDLLSAGFIEAKLVSFSSEKIVIDRTYFSKNMEDVYVLCEEDGHIVAKTPDLSETFATSAISLSLLPESVATQITNGRYYLTIDQVYDFFEAYSS